MASPAERAAVRSAVCITSPPHLTDDGREWFVPLAGRDGRRAVQPGEHLPVDHPLALAWFAAHFTSSAEPPDCWPVGVLGEEGRKRQQAEQQRLTSSPARRVSFVCVRCNATAAQSVIVTDLPGQLDLINALSTVDESDADGWAQRQRIELRFAALARTAQEQTIELARAEAEWRASHQQCPPGTPPVEEPTVPERVPLSWRLPGVRTLQ